MKAKLYFPSFKPILCCVNVVFLFLSRVAIKQFMNWILVTINCQFQHVLKERDKVSFEKVELLISNNC